MRRTALGLALAATLFSSPALAVEMSAETRRDLNCLILFADVGNSMQNQTEEQKIGFSSILGYFYGKIFSRNSAFDLKAALTPETLKTARASTESVRQACSAEAKTFGDTFTAAAEILDK
jgi:hypothetical protein